MSDVRNYTRLVEKINKKSAFLEQERANYKGTIRSFEEVYEHHIKELEQDEKEMKSLLKKISESED
jgi:hypothetical protein